MINRSNFQNGLSIRHLQVIAALADVKLVARVAEVLNITQPAVSKRISELERIVDASIVTRDRNRLYLTDIGLRLASHAKQVLSQLERAQFDIESMASGISGSVSIGVVSSVASLLLPSAIAVLKSNSPLVTISIFEGHFVSLFPELESGKIDLLIARIWQQQELPGVEQITLYKEPIVVVVGRDHHLARKENVSWADVVDEPWILPQANSIARQGIDTLFAENRLAPPKNTITSLSISLNLEILKSMPAIGLLPQSLALDHAARANVTILPLDTRGFLSEVRCFWKTDKLFENSTTSLFLKCLQQASEKIKTIPFG